MCWRVSFCSTDWTTPAASTRTSNTARPSGMREKKSALPPSASASTCAGGPISATASGSVLRPGTSPRPSNDAQPAASMSAAIARIERAFVISIGQTHAAGILVRRRRRVGRRALATLLAFQQGSDRALTAFGCRHPGTVDERRLVARVLAVAALQMRDPVAFLVLVEARNPSLHAARRADDRQLPRLQAEIAAPALRSEPDHPVSIDLQHRKHFSLVGLQSRLIFRRQAVRARVDRLDADLRAGHD